jgi:hypothetical protein
MGKNRDTKMLTRSTAIEVREGSHHGCLCASDGQCREDGRAEETILLVGRRNSVSKQPAPEFNLKIAPEWSKRIHVDDTVETVRNPGAHVVIAPTAKPGWAVVAQRRRSAYLPGGRRQDRKDQDDNQPAPA